MRELPGPRWAADPYGRHELRYWDGGGWTADVSDDGVTGIDTVFGVAAASDATAATAETVAPAVATSQAVTEIVPVGAGALGSDAAGPAPQAELTVSLTAPTDTPSVDTPTVTTPSATPPDALFGASTVSAKTAVPTYRRPPATVVRGSGLVIGICALALTGLVAGVVAFSGLPQSGRKSVTRVAAPPTTTPDPGPTTDQPDRTVSEKPTLYGGPETSAVDDAPVPRITTATVPRMTTATVPRTTSEPVPRITTSTTPRMEQPPPSQSSTRPPTATETRPVPTLTRPNELVQYPSCQAMNRDHPHGVGRPGARDRRRGSGGDRVRDFTVNAPLYLVNVPLDVDGDGIACEA